MSNYQQGMTLKALLENPELLNPPKPNEGSDKLGKKDGDELDAFSSQSAFLVPNLWEKTLPYDGNDFKLEFMDLDEFLNENCLPNEKSGGEKMSPRAPVPEQQSPQLPPQAIQPIHQELSTNSSSNSNAGSTGGLLAMGPASSPPAQLVNPSTLLPQSPVALQAGSPAQSPTRTVPNSPVSGDVSVDYSLTQTDVVLSTIPGEETYDPRRRHFSEEELRPQPMIKKSKKVFVPDDLKDEKYWNRRQKNNIAAKRSRDARRIKENQIALRAAFLEKENSQLKMELEKSRRETKALKKRIMELEGSGTGSSS